MGANSRNAIERGREINSPPSPAGINARTGRRGKLNPGKNPSAAK
ncbi:hypothetical protein [Nostoc sp.]